MKITVFKCENCGASELTRDHSACAYCSSTVFIEEMVERREMSGARLVGETRRGEDFRHAVLTGAKLVGSTFVDCSFYGADFGDAKVVGSTFANCDMRAARTVNARMVGCTYSNCRR